MASVTPTHDRLDSLPSPSVQPPPGMQPPTYTSVPTHDALQILPYADSPRKQHGEVPAPRPHRRPFFSMDGLLVSCLIPPLMGFGFVALGLYTIYGHSTLVISHSTEHAAVVSQAFTALFSSWHFLALLPALSVVDSVRSEEWWRRLLRTTSFSRANSVSSNIGGTFAHTVEIVASWSSPYFKSAWVAALIVVVLADIAPGAIHVQIGSDPIPASFPVPALPQDSIYSNYSTPFLFTGDQFHASVDIAPVYYKASLFAATDVKSIPPAPNVLVPRPNISPGQGYRYLTDVVFMDYQCDWHAPVLAGPDSMTDITTQTLSITAGAVQGLAFAPLLGNNIYPLIGYTDPSSGNPSFEGNVAFVVTSGTPLPGSGYFNLSSIPNSTPSASWQAAAAAWRANQTLPSEPVEFLSVAVCSPEYFIEPWVVDLVNGSTTLVELQSKSVGNLDPTQLNIAIQDCFHQLPFAPPIYLSYGLSIAQLTMLFTIPSDMSLPGIPYSSENITSLLNSAIPSSVQAYLDNFPFGNFTPSTSKRLVPALVLSAELNFICATAALYALLSGALFYLFRRQTAKPFTIRSVLGATRETPFAHIPDTYCGQAVASQIEHIATAADDIDDSAKEARINKFIGDYHTMVREDLPTRRPVLQINSHQDPPTPNLLLDRYENVRTRRSRILWAFTPVFGGTLVGFGIATWRHPHIVSHSPQDTRATLFSALFTWGIGLWRSASLLAISGLIRQANSDEWSRLLKHPERANLGPNLRGIFNEISTNTMSFLDAFRAAWMTRTSIIFKVCYVAALLASLCAVVAQGAVTLLVLPSMTNQELAIPLLARDIPIEVPWSADQNLAPFNAGLIGTAQLGTSWAYLEQIVGASVGDTMPPGYLVPLRERTNNTAGSQYPTDVAQVQCECSWVAPTLPPATANVSYISVYLDSFGINAIQPVPRGIAMFAPLSNMTFSNSTPVTSGLFAWTLWGGGPGDPINLASVPSTNLSMAWQELITDEIAPAFIQSTPADAPYVTNLTRATTLVCDPRIQFMPKQARDFGGSVDLASVPAEYSTGVRNIDEAFVKWMVYSYAIQQSLDIVGIFRPYIIFGLATGNATLTSDPSNPVGGTVPKPAAEIGNTLDAYIGSSSKAWIVQDLAPNSTTVSGQVIQQSLIITAALPQVLVAGALYLLLGLAALIISFRTPGAPFTVAGVLMMHSKLAALHLSDKDDEKDDDMVEGLTK